MRSTKKYRILFIIAALLLLLIAAALGVRQLLSGIHLPSFSRRHPAVTVTPDPHEGQVLINDGFDDIWITPLEGVAVNPFERSDFTDIYGTVDYIGSDYSVLRGIDVSSYQFDINWSAVSSANLDFAYIRLGYRGYTKGGLYTDSYFEKNIAGAKSIGLKTGVYFFSQAITPEEAVEEAEYVLETVRGLSLDLPIMFDWEKIEDTEEARTNGLSVDVRTRCAVAFCERIKEAGYEVGVYFNRYIGYYGYDVSQLNQYYFWIAVPGSFPDYYYFSDAGNYWQYSASEVVPGIDVETDMNLIFIPNQPGPTATAAPNS